MMSKNLFSWGVKMSLFATLFLPSVVSAEFSDVPADDPYVEAISYGETEAIVNGYADGTFRPGSAITRAEFIKIIIGAQFSLEEIAACAVQDFIFPDVAADAWYAAYICLAVEQNILSGYPDGTFGPGKTISFAEAAKVLANVFIPEGAQSADPWYRPFAEKLAEKKAIPLTITSFEQAITRAEMVEMLYRLRAEITTKPSQTYVALAAGKPIGSNSEDARCSLVPQSGFCKAFIPKYYFDPASQRCTEFIWGGCDGVVPFQTLQECQSVCEPSLTTNTPPITVLPPVHEITMTAKTWEFSPEVLTVKKGETVRLKITSLDVEHGFALPEFDINTELSPGKTTIVEFIPDKVGTFTFFCSVFCGSGHSGMKGIMIVEA